MKTTKKTTVKVNVLAEEITMSKATAKRAAMVGTKEYKDFAQAKRDFPDFTIKITSPKASENSNKGLTLTLMENLIKEMSNDSRAAIEGFEKVKESYKGTNFSYSKPKAYFLKKYPDWREWLPEVEQGETEIAPQEVRTERKGFFN